MTAPPRPIGQRPTTVDEVVGALAGQPGLVPVAGGTDVMVDIAMAGARPPGVIDLRAVPELVGVEGTRIGAAVPLTQIRRAFSDQRALDLALGAVGSPQIQARASLGGNIATASPAGDTLLALLVLDAQVEIAGPGGRRSAPLAEVLVGPRRTTLAPGEVLVATTVRRAARSAFAKVGPRGAMNISACAVAAARHDDGRILVAAGAVAPTARRLGTVEALLARDEAPSDADVDDAVQVDIAPIDDHRASAAYRRQATATIVRRCLRALRAGTAR